MLIANGTGLTTINNEEGLRPAENAIELGRLGFESIIYEYVMDRNEPYKK